MKDSIIKNTGNSRYLKSAISAATTWEQFRAALIAGTLPIDLNGINSAGWQQVGDALNKANLLSDATVAALNAFLTSALPENPQVTDALNALATTGISKISTGSYVGTGSYGSGSKNSIALNFTPHIVIILGRRSSAYFDIGFICDELEGGLSLMCGNSSISSGKPTTQVSGHTVQWYGTSVESQLNVSGVTYKYIAIG